MQAQQKSRDRLLYMAHNNPMATTRVRESIGNRISATTARMANVDNKAS